MTEVRFIDSCHFREKGDEFRAPATIHISRLSVFDFHDAKVVFAYQHALFDPGCQSFVRSLARTGQP